MKTFISFVLLCAVCAVIFGPAAVLYGFLFYAAAFVISCISATKEK